MTVVVTLAGYAPPARADNIAFTKAKVEESTDGKTGWAPIETINLEPIDSDPEHPVTRTLTTTHATIPAGGYYRVVWLDNAGNSSAPTAAALDASELAGGIRPTVTDVANLLRARTKVRGGAESGTFSENTRPTADQVDGLIDEAVDDVLGKVKSVNAFKAMEPTPSEEEAEGYERRVRGAIKLYAAILVETSYFPEQVRQEQSAATLYKDLFGSRIKALIAEGETGEAQGEGGEGTGGSSPGSAYWNFDEPPGSNPGVGMATRY